MQRTDLRFANLDLGNKAKMLILLTLVGAGRFELPTPSPPDWCANQAALRYAMHNLGATGGKEFLTAVKANPDARVDSVITNRDVIDGNKGLYGDGSITLQLAT